MNTLRNLAALALLAFAAISPAHAEQAAEGTKTSVVADGAPVDGSSDVRKLLEDRPEIAALTRGGNEEAMTDALKEQISNAGGEKAIADALKEQLKNAGGEKAAADALNEYLSKHPLKDGQDIKDLARNGKEKAIAAALKARFGKHP
ncbi:hypothetical protein J2X04_000859 [Lysobacter niabensis]|uniref:Uncharacterized protein n=1 Tax=Agrilutibacter niabensis TaxID=380628 RepID=A0ABU1VM14_9GAMM|nr:hypothetical protein [Lysobacter niabensis]MDR7098512.1 hypothetical protein [Lysobacter niabensis]